MNDLVSTLERKISRYAVPRLTMKMIICYIIGYIIYYMPGLSGILKYMTLDTYAILHGQVWRLVTWILMPPETSNLFFTVIMLVFYYSIGTTMERVWGDARYNLYILSGLLFTVIGAFVTMGLVYLVYPKFTAPEVAAGVFAGIASNFTIYYVNMSILLAFAATFPDNVVLLFFVIPLKMKWMGVIYGAWLGAEALISLMRGSFWNFFPIAASLLNFAVFWFAGGRGIHLRPSEVKRRVKFKRETNRAREGMQHMTPKGIAKHKCAICGQTELDHPDLEFRFCSKCNGNYEYCQEHLFTHQHRV
ncbi:MAG: rhomboid family intramembrane serine protease [Lachnospiraceae bacterium]|nr:rhomboid family intramembrane serine protease [Lachnospiraceae bacterium]